MSQTTTLVLLPQTVHNDGTVTGTARQAASYYLGNRDLQTINWSVSDLKGSLHIQASLATSPSETDWFPVFDVTYDTESAISYTNLSGNFVWVRAVMTEFSLGVVQYVKMSY
jgi:hypothetical protein